MNRFWLFLFALAMSPVWLGAAAADPAPQPTDAAYWNDPGPTGYHTRQLVLTSACLDACPWGELGEFVRDAMAPDGYTILLCRNCNRDRSPRLVAKASLPPPLEPGDLSHGPIARYKAPIDFGFTEASMLKWAYEGKFLYAKDGPYRNLRLIARIEDPFYLLVAVKHQLGIKSLAEIRARKLPLRIMTDNLPSTAPVLDYYGLDKKSVESWGGSIVSSWDAKKDTAFDVIVSSLATPANNPESKFWTQYAATYDLDFLDLPEDLLDGMVKNADMVRATAHWGLIRGIERPIATVARSGEVLFARDDMPDDIAYAVAKAVDRARGELKWYIRPYSIDPRTVGDGKGVPLHPGAARYYREMGYLK